MRIRVTSISGRFQRRLRSDRAFLVSKVSLVWEMADWLYQSVSLCRISRRFIN